ncbi:hypothetical protein KC19_10G149100 [Ceratodon purpureus]|uniref:Uncharacterized protein n=1 Tax=Ceratodon purpureus TaxID=3225 RepID=A0A8T0GM19_CERPU|nr:hypothetical protein KC19_10G149100 [Ceratodon purpureus]
MSIFFLLWSSLQSRLLRSSIERLRRTSEPPVIENRRLWRSFSTGKALPAVSQKQPPVKCARIVSSSKTRRATSVFPVPPDANNPNLWLFSSSNSFFAFSTTSSPPNTVSLFRHL